MSDLRVRKRYDLAEVAEWLCMDKRTIRRWCERGIVPGAYRSKNGLGHWRIRNPSRASLALLERLPLWCRRSKRVKGESSSFSNINVAQFRKELSDPDSPGNLARAIYFARYHATTREELIANRLRTHTPELRHDLHRISLAELNRKIPLEVWRIARSPLHAKLYIAVLKLRFMELPLTRKSLAQTLKISKASLYRKYSLEQIRLSLSAVGRLQVFTADTTAHNSASRGHRRFYRVDGE